MITDEFVLHPLSLEEFDIAALLREVLDSVMPLAQQNGNTVIVQFSNRLGLMHADLMKTRQILLNLLGNAAKVTCGGAITINVERDAGAPVPTVTFVVTDTGPGMPGMADAQHASVSRVCGPMGGHVWVKSEPGRGARFTVRLPLDVAAVVGDFDTKPVQFDRLVERIETLITARRRLPSAPDDETSGHPEPMMC